MQIWIKFWLKRWFADYANMDKNPVKEMVCGLCKYG